MLILPPTHILRKPNQNKIAVSISLFSLILINLSPATPNSGVLILHQVNYRELIAD